MLTRFTLRQSSSGIDAHHPAADFSRSFRFVYHTDRRREVTERGR